MCIRDSMSATALFDTLPKTMLWLLPTPLTTFWSAGDMAAHGIKTVSYTHLDDLDEFLNLMKRAGYEVKTVRGGGISFRLTGQGPVSYTHLSHRR